MYELHVRHTLTSYTNILGCCKSDACAATPPSTCAHGDLVPAFMERSEQFNAYASASATPAPKKNNTGAIGGVVGGVVVLAVIGAIIFFVLRRRRNRKRTEGEMRASAMVPMMNAEKGHGNRDSVQYGGQSRMLARIFGFGYMLTFKIAPPTYSAPIQEPSKGHNSYHQYAQNAAQPQELPAEIVSSAEQRYSELPANVSNGVDTQRYSELPAESARAVELESPQITPRPLQSEFSNDMAKRLPKGWA
jgi:hypothetical protein